MAQSEASKVIASLFGLMTQTSPNQVERDLRRSRKSYKARTPVWKEQPEVSQKDSERPDEQETANLESAAKEARALFGLIRPGNRETVSSLRALISVPQKEREALIAFVRKNPAEGDRILGALRFRHMVLYEFDSLVRSAANAERIAAAEAEAAERAAAEIPDLPVLHELVVSVNV